MALIRSTSLARLDVRIDLRRICVPPWTKSLRHRRFQAKWPNGYYSTPRALSNHLFRADSITAIPATILAKDYAAIDHLIVSLVRTPNANHSEPAPSWLHTLGHQSLHQQDDPTLEVATKVLQLSKEVVPSVSRIALLRDPTNSSHLLLDDRIVAAARALGLRPQFIDVRGAADFQDAFAAILQQRAQALLVYPLPLPPADIGQIVQFALSNKLPGLTFWEGYAEQGFLMFYGARLSDQYRRAAGYVDKILKGANPSDLPVEQPTKFELVINLKTAKALGLEVSTSLLLSADELIE